jgi:hypothetical protein
MLINFAPLESFPIAYAQDTTRSWRESDNG